MGATSCGKGGGARSRPRRAPLSSGNRGCLLEDFWPLVVGRGGRAPKEEKPSGTAGSARGDPPPGPGHTTRCYTKG